MTRPRTLIALLCAGLVAALCVVVAALGAAGTQGEGRRRAGRRERPARGVLTASPWAPASRTSATPT